MLSHFASTQSPLAHVGPAREKPVSRKQYARRRRVSLRDRLYDALLVRALKFARAGLRKRRQRRKAECETPLARMAGC
ncbi:MAG: hypothetical protein KF696_11165 [Planctomycetes bacterium]|nr:hypothetical protein [Planctomycetota bacterium]MCW8135788.1 hypothetical protein [Planctomycetota bacterium]